MTKQAHGFDFTAHAENAVAEYRERRGFYESLASAVKRVLDEAFKPKDIQVHSVQARAKEPLSFGKKAAQSSETDPAKPKYARPLEEITDLSGVRVITYFPGTVEDVNQLIKDEFQIMELADKGAELFEEDRFGYQSIHYVVKFKSPRSTLPEYARFAEFVTEIQVRTILQHAWAEIEHDIQYKSTSSIPPGILRRRFMALAGMLELADREFQEIQNVDRKLSTEARSRVAEGQLSHVGITPIALKAFLDKELGPDGRMSEWSYDWTARILKILGFRTLEQVEICISGFDDDRLSRAASQSRLGQTTRFEYMLLAGMGEKYIHRHPWGAESWFEERAEEDLDRFKQAGIAIGEYDPHMDQPDILPESSLTPDSTGSPEGQSGTEVMPNI